MNYYNENDPKAAAWLSELIAAGDIPEGIVDGRDIQLIKPEDLEGFCQVHLFAGIGGWSLALRLAGWPDEEPCFTGSVPCQPFSIAGKQLAQADERHLWPFFFQLIRQCKPLCVFGEQVASAIGKGWLDGISDDLEAEGYACGAAVLGAFSVGAPHIRKRLYWVANLQRAGLEGLAANGHDGNQPGRLDPLPAGPVAACGGAWDSYDLLPCLDGKTRRIESGTFPLVARLPGGVVPSGDPSIQEVQATAEARVMRLRGYGNSIVSALAAEFIQAYLETK